MTINGLIAPNLTPFNDNLSVAEDLYIKHAHSLIEAGCSGLAPFGTTGEALSVGIEERMHMLEMMITSGISPDMIIPGTGLTNLPDTVLLTQHAIDQGCAGAMTLPPFYFKDVSDEGIFQYFEQLISQVDRPDLQIYLYHIPQVAGVGLSIELVARLRSAFPSHIVGIKDSSGDFENTKALMNIDGLIVYPGSELPLLEALGMSAFGCISATANLHTYGICDVIEAFNAGDIDVANQAQTKAKEMRLTIQDYGPIPAQKGLLAKISDDNRWMNVRPPLLSITPEKRDELYGKISDGLAL